MNNLKNSKIAGHYMKTKTSILTAITAMSTAACSYKAAVDLFWLLGSGSFIIAMILYPLRKKISPFIKKFLGSKDNKNYLLIFFIVFFLFREEIFSQQIDFKPAVETFRQVLRDFSRITAGACGFYGLTRVAWLLVNEDRSAGSAFVLAVIGFIAATIAVGMLG